MSSGRIDRVVVFCLSLETVKIVKPIEFYKPDRAYLLYFAETEIYKDFKREVEAQVRGMGVDLIPVRTEVWDFAGTLRELVNTMRREKGNAVYVNVDGPGAYPAAAMVASMMEGGVPFFAKTLEQNIPAKAYYRGARPFGRSAKVDDPVALPAFPLPPPDDTLVRGLSVWLGMEDGRKLMTDAKVMEGLREAGVPIPAGTGQQPKMLYRRRFLEKWVESGWLERDGRGRYRATGYGRIVARIFGE